MFDLLFFYVFIFIYTFFYQKPLQWFRLFFINLKYLYNPFKLKSVLICFSPISHWLMTLINMALDCKHLYLETFIDKAVMML